ncbi:MAG: hypothetical protein IJ296_04480 [Bacteroidales bacterium]|nr:hypothetical protein [Bacteroidales bacterium]
MKKETKSKIKSDLATSAGSSVGATIGVMTGNILAADEPEKAEAGHPELTDEPEPAEASEHIEHQESASQPQYNRNAGPTAQAAQTSQQVHRSQTVQSPQSEDAGPVEKPQPARESETVEHSQVSEQSNTSGQQQETSRPEQSVQNGQSEQARGDGQVHNAVLHEEVTEEEGEIVVVGRGIIENGAGEQMDVAVLQMDNEMAMLVDGDIDGIADVLIVDENGNERIDEGEMISLDNGEIRMDAFQVDPVAVNTNDTLACNNEEDYVHDANVEDYNA